MPGLFERDSFPMTNCVLDVSAGPAKPIRKNWTSNFNTFKISGL